MVMIERPSYWCWSFCASFAFFRLWVCSAKDCRLSSSILPLPFLLDDHCDRHMNQEDWYASTCHGTDQMSEYRVH
ncbi:uncharacterized protein B0T23DRAFT_6484 [Neurospora hispaniola]|uniref:Secreted protein n=1 Tax=Neurospora hispaniola TaxID=588809 RepID=A0AAJ0IER3_9PEZI|nr:hypothetical protein B0T23DRAFT_6484 [Neurospora hispaniola]